MVFRAKHVRDIVLHIITKNSEIQKVVNVGCSYGWLENQISRSCPSVNVYGIDRSKEAMGRNNNDFRRGNLEFIAGGFHSIVKDRPDILKNAIVCHVNFGAYFLLAFLMEIYRVAFRGTMNIVFMSRLA